jgi:hypothetical protein
MRIAVEKPGSMPGFFTVEEATAIFHIDKNKKRCKLGSVLPS